MDGWPAQATANPPAYPFRTDRTRYEAPGMTAWRVANLPCSDSEGRIVGDDDTQNERSEDDAMEAHDG